MINEIDRHTSVLTETIARRVSRRAALYKFARGFAGVTAALSIGNLAAARDALADPTPGCGCAFPGGPCGGNCPSGGGCPSGCVKCLSSDCGDPCLYADGSWIDTDCPCGPTGNGFYLCTDCRCLTCNDKCGCRSSCLCGGCRTKQEVALEMARFVYGTP